MFWKKKKISKKSHIKEWIKAVIIAVLIAIFIRTFIIQSFTVTSVQMENGLYAGDYIFVNKLKFGARFPVTILSLPFTNNIYADWIQIPYWRLPAFGSIKHGDIIVFNYPAESDPPIDKRARYIKRLIGLPGDTLKIDDKILYINNKSYDTLYNLKYKYRIVTDGTNFTDSILNRYHITDGGIVADMGIFDFFISPNIADSILNLQFVNNVRILKEFPSENTWTYFPQNNYFNWNKDYYGPLIIPQKEKTVKINIKNIGLYKKIIEVYENNKLLVENNKIIINGIETNTYTFKNNYYFVIDDNRDNAKDSRFWGFLPENHIIGTASFIWYSTEHTKSGNSIRWNRIFKSI